MRITLVLLFNFIFFGLIVGQSTAYVLQFGPTAGLQKWDNSSGREPLFQYHAALSTETINNEDNKGSFYMQLGYHVKGSATRYRFFNFNNTPGGTFTEQFKFNNFSFSLGAKQRFKESASGSTRYFYFGGLRGDYTYSTNIDGLTGSDPNKKLYYPLMGGVQRWMAGFSLGGGIEFDFSELVGGQIQLSINPDVTPQYRQIAIPNVPDPWNPGQNITIPERRIRNTTVEISFGLRLLHKVVVLE